MKQDILDVLEKTYNSDWLRQNTVPLFMSNPGLGKSSTIKKWVESKKVDFLKITLSQRMPNEVVGAVMPNTKKKTWEVFDNEQLLNLKPGSVLFFDEVFNGTMKQTLDALLNLLEDRMLPSGQKLPDVMIVAASNPQGLIHLTPQIKERFIKYDLKFDAEEYKAYLAENYGMPPSISRHLCTLISKEQFLVDSWNFHTPRSIEKALIQIGNELKSPLDDVILPYLQEKVTIPEDKPSFGWKKDDEVEYIKIFKPWINKTKNTINVTQNKKRQARNSANLPS